MSQLSMFRNVHMYKSKLRAIEERIKEKLEEYNDDETIKFLFELLQIAHIVEK